MYVRYTLCYLSSIMIFGAYCVGKAHKMLSSTIIIICVYYIGRVQNMLPW